MSHCDFVICNESEAAAWAAASGLPDQNDIPAIAKSLATLPKSNASRARTVIITQGPRSTVVVTSSEPDTPKIYEVHPLKDEEIVDTNGAGDAFAGGFIGGLVLGKSLDECVIAGHKMGAMNVQLVSYSAWTSFSRVAHGVRCAGRPHLQVAQGAHLLKQHGRDSFLLLHRLVSPLFSL